MEEATTVSSLRFNLTSESLQPAINSNFKVRNIILGCLGILVNAVAFFITMTSTKLKEGRKLLLLNLILADATFMGSMIIYGVEESTQRSEGRGCLPVIFTIVLSLQNSYMLCLMISVVNFLAVYKPFKFAQLVSWKYTGIAVSLCWLKVTGLTYLWVVAPFPPGIMCAPIVIMPDPGLVGMSTLLVVVSIGVFGLNGAVVFKLKYRARLQVGHANVSNPTERENEASRSSGRRSPKSNTGRAFFNRFFNAYYARGSNNKVKPVDTIVRESDKLPTASSIWMGGENASETSTQIQQVQSDALGVGPSTSHPVFTDGNSDQQKGRNGLKRAPTLSINEDRISAGDRIGRDLVILTSFSCMITLPIAIYLIFIAAGIIKDPEYMVNTAVGIFISSCPVIKSAVNPFFNVINSVHWRKMLRPVCGQCVT